MEFRSADKADERIDVISSEIELLEHVRFTETCEELDTLTVSADLVKDPERFQKVCATIVGTNFLRIPPTMNELTPTGSFKTGYPVWLQPGKFNSLAKWLILFIERAIWVNFSAHV